MRTFIIAELGGIAEGRLSAMRQQVAACAAAKVDAVKAQWVSDPLALVDARHAQGYAGAYQHLAYPAEWLRLLKAEATAVGLRCGCSVYLADDVIAVAPLGLDFLKVSSFEAGASALVERVRSWSALTHRPVYISTGMAEADAVSELLNQRALGQLIDARMLLLHCVSHYAGPIPVDQWQLGAIRHYCLDGFSDHTRHLEAGADAVLAGAHVLEVHMRLDSSNPANPDYGVAWAPADLAEYVRRVREAEAKLGDGVKRQQPCEQEMAQFKARVA